MHLLRAPNAHSRCILFAAVTVTLGALLAAVIFVAATDAWSLTKHHREGSSSGLHGEGSERSFGSHGDRSVKIARGSIGSVVCFGFRQQREGFSSKQAI